MATKTTAPTSPDYERGRVAGMFTALQAAVQHGGMCLASDGMRTLAEALDVPVLFVESAQEHEFADVEKLTEWWSARKAVA